MSGHQKKEIMRTCEYCGERKPLEEIDKEFALHLAEGMSYRISLIEEYAGFTVCKQCAEKMKQEEE